MLNQREDIRDGRLQLKWASIVLIAFALLMIIPSQIRSAITVSAKGQGGEDSRAVDDSGGAFDLTVPLNKNAVNTIVVTAVDRFGNRASKEVSVTQVALDSIVVSKVTSERLSVQQVEQLVREGTIKLDNPQNYNVSKFDIVLTIAGKPVPISVPIVSSPMAPEDTGSEKVKMPKGDDSGAPTPSAVEIIVFEKTISTPPDLNILAPSIPGVIIIEGNIKSLKEFFTVRLLLMNMSGIFTLKDVAANIEFPGGGLSNVLPADGLLSFGSILPGNGDQPGQMEKQFIIRGDDIGRRSVKVNFAGTLVGPGIPEDRVIPFNGSAFTEVEVKGPPTFLVKVRHPDAVVTSTPYDLRVDIMNTGDITAMYASLALDVGADARIAKCRIDDAGNPQCVDVEGSDVRNFGHITPGETVSASFTINPRTSGIVSSCVAASDQNISLQVLVGNIGCIAGTFPPEREVPAGIATVSVLPTPNAFGIAIDSPVTAFFSEAMLLSSITTGAGGTFNVFDKASNLIPGEIRFEKISNKTVVIWQVNDGITNRLAHDKEYTVYLLKDIRDLEGNPLFNGWTSKFTTTGMALDDMTPPSITLSVEPPVNPNYVLPGQIVKVNAYAADQGSGVVRVELRGKSADEAQSVYKLLDQKVVFAGDQPPYIFALDSGKLPAGRPYQLMATAYDYMENTQNTTLTLIVAASAAPPTIALGAEPWGEVLQGVSLNLMPQLTGGVMEVRYYLNDVLFKTVNLPPFAASVGTIALVPGNRYAVRAEAMDALNQSGSDTYVFTVAANPNVPTVTFTGTLSGANYITGSSFAVSGKVEDPFGIFSMSYRLDSPDGSVISSGSQPFAFNTTGLALGPHTIYLVATNNVGKTGTASLPFSVVNPSQGTPPLAPTVSSVSFPEGGQVTVSGTSVAGARVDIGNTKLGITATVNADGSGAYVGSVPADSGHPLRVIAYDFTQSASPSQATTVVVPQVPVLLSLSAAPDNLFFSAQNAFRDIAIAGTYTGGTTADLTSKVTYRSSNPAVASVNSTGRVAALANGSATIIATMDTSQVQIPVTVSIVTLTSITVSPSVLNFTAVGQSGQLTVTGHYSDGSTQDFTGSATYGTGNIGVAAVNASGVVTAVGGGTTGISISRSGLAPISVTINVNVVSLHSLTVSPASIGFIYHTQTQQLTVSGNYSDGSTRVLSSGNTFVSANNSVASVSSGGLVSAVGNGNTQITVSRSGVAPVQIGVTVDTTQDPAPTAMFIGPANGSSVERGRTVSVSVRAQDSIGGVSKILLDVTGETTYSESRSITPASLDTTQSFTFPVSSTAAIDGTISISVQATDTSDRISDTASLTLKVVDQTAPVVTITAPVNQTSYNFGDTVTVTVTASDAVGVASVRYAASGGVTVSELKVVSPVLPITTTAFSFKIPYGFTNPDVRIRAYAMDATGNEGSASPIDIIVTSADIISPQTQVISVADPGSSTLTTVTYKVTSGLSDLDHVELYFRRNSLGAFNRYTDADNGNAEGKYVPQSGDTGTILFDSTKMGGDGTYEFYSVGVDRAGNREAPPVNTPASPADYTGLIAYYPFNGTTLDESGHGNNGTANGGVFTTDRFGVANKAYLFNGSSTYINIGAPVPASLQIQSELTLAAWIYVTQYPAGDTLGMIVGCQNDGNRSGYSILLDGRTNPDGQTSPAGHIHFQIVDGNWGHHTNVNAQIPLNQWVHVAATRKANEAAKVYYNGVLQPSTSGDWGGGIIYNGAEFDIGRQSDFGNRYFNGAIDDVQVYNRALTEAETKDFISHVVPDKTGTFNAGTIWTVIASPATAGEGDSSYDNQNIRVNGTTFTVNGSHTFKNVELLNGAVLTHAGATTTSETKLDLTVWSVSIDNASTINTTGKGYLGGSTSWHEYGRTLGNIYGAHDGAGGSYGGLGGGYNGQPSNPVYGYLTDPKELGSGGGTWDYTPGGAGGGLIKLTAINMANDGPIQSNGGQSAGTAAGDGSGGGINIKTTTISGSGSVSANGGGNGVGSGGGGGRIAITSIDRSTFNSDHVQALGGFGLYANGANGTVVFIQQNKAELVLTGQGPSSPWIDLTLPPNYVFDSVTFRDNARVIAHDAFTVTGKVVVTGNSILTHDSQNTNGLVINAKTVQVDEGSSIDVTGRGYVGGSSTWHEHGKTLGNVYGAYDGAGGSYGGVGSGYQNQPSGPIYGDPKNPAYLGSGGGTWDYTPGGAGGGRITINATDAVIVNGVISANGGQSSGSAAGNGSGGSVLIQTSKLSGTGFITAHGGGNGIGVGGGGGRVAVYCDYVDPTSDLNSLYNIAALGKTGQYDSRQTTPGTVYIKYSNQKNGNLYIDAGLTDSDGKANRTSTDSIVFTPINFGVTTAVTADTLTTDGLTALLPGSLVGIRINPNINQAESFVIQSNTASTITVKTPNENGKNFTDLSAIGKTYSGYYLFDNIIFRRGGNLMIGDLLEVTDTLSIAEYGKLTHYGATASIISWLDLKATNLVIDATGSIDATGKGYMGGGTAWHERGRTVGNVYGGSDGTGGSYGGVAVGYEGRASNALYGSLTNPTDLGSGGGTWDYTPGGAGGGLILVTATNLQVDGAIRSNGGQSAGSAAGDGSGGTVNITVANLSGTGTIQAKGGGDGVGSGGGGGRIAVSYSGLLSLPEQNISAIGGTGQYGSPGGNGTVYLKKHGQTYGNLIIDGYNRSTLADSTRIPGGYTFDNLTLRNNAQVVADEKITVTGKLLVTGNSILTHGAGNESGLIISADTVQVDQGSSINAVGRGYSGGSTSWHERGRTLGNVYGSADGAGGSYGGLGGGYQSRSSYLVYGDPKNPVFLGSGGGTWDYTPGGAGGGRITINASSRVIINGTISANGADSSGSAAGGGSGGSILIHTAELSGNGYIQANGGGNGPGGGGGRVAVFYSSVDPVNNLNNLYNIKAFNGRGSYADRPATAGTVYVKHIGGEDFLYIDDNVVDGNGVANGTASQSTPLTPIGFGITSSVTDTGLVTDGLVSLMPGGLVGLRINPDVGQNETFVIEMNTNDTIMVVSPNEHSVNWSSVAGVGKTYAGYYEYDNVMFTRGGNLVVGDLLNVKNTMNISEYGLLTHYGATTTTTSRLDLAVGNLVIDATGRINANGRGYVGGTGWDEKGRTQGNVYGASDGTGGSYGGSAVGYEGRPSNPVYGSETNPMDLGSGGGAWDSSPGGNGGGLILIDAGNITLNGVITANGGVSGGSAAGDGSGGTVNIHTGSLSGAGVIQANGGISGSAGSGGRIAISYSGVFSLSPGNQIHALGGQGPYGSSNNGTIVINGVPHNQ